MAATCTSLQSPPRAVLTPRAASARAMPRMLLTPLAWISLMMGRTLAANASAASLRALMDALRAAARRGPPSLAPRRLAAARAALVRSLIAPAAEEDLKHLTFQQCALSWIAFRRPDDLSYSWR